MKFDELPPIAKRILEARGLKEEGYKFLFPKLSDLSDPFLLPDIEKASQRIMKAIIEGEKIALFGDYDADGITSCALFFNFFRALSIRPFVYIPKRTEGYGLNREAIFSLKERGVSLIICLDCGSTNVEEIALAKNLDMDSIVVDHHEIKRPYPCAVAIVNPKREDSIFPTRELASCGVTFFLLMALRRMLIERGILRNKINLKKDLDLVAIGTYADMVPLTGDNRIFAKYGCQVMMENPKIWLETMKRKKVITESIDEWVMNFLIVPRINAPGRVSDPLISFSFLTSEKEEEIEELFYKISFLNSERQRQEEETLKESLEVIEKEGYANRKFFVLFKEGWPLGVLGLVAQRITEIYGKPSLVLTEKDGVLKGSGRGVEGFDLYSTLSSFSLLYLKFGGHKYACGVTLKKESLETLRDCLERHMEEVRLPQRKKRIDTEAEFSEFLQGFADFLELFAPYGVGNPRPAVLVRPQNIEFGNGEYVKLIDKRNTIWDGFLKTEKKESFKGIVVLPYIKVREGSRFFQFMVIDFVE